MKPFWRSRTLWLNTIAAMLVALEASTGAIEPYLPIDLYALLAVVLPLLNAALRVITTQGLHR